MEKCKASYKNNKFQILAPKWNKNFGLLDESHCVLDIQDYFNYIIKKRETVPDNPPIKLYVNQIENRITFRIKAGYYLQRLTSKQWNYFEALKLG